MGVWNKGKALIDWNEKIKTKTGGQFELVERIVEPSGESRLHIRCKICGTDKTIGASSIRGTNKIRCLTCDMNETKNRHEFEAEQKKIQKVVRHNKQRTQVSFKVCQDCGMIIPFGKARLCDSCRAEHRRLNGLKFMREQSRRADIKRRARLRQVKRDRDITAEKLFDRDGGICHICGRDCDWNDCRWENGVFKIGKTYPTIDHLIPISLGGDDTWENIKLACLSCNSKKGNRVSISPLG